MVGTISTSIGNIVNLNQLTLRNNHMTGTIPTEIGLLANLNYLDLSYNGQERCSYQNEGNDDHSYGGNSYGSNGGQILVCKVLGGFMGTLPAELYTLQWLNTLNLAMNKLTGTISPLVSRLANLYNFQLSGNSFSGTIPSSLSSIVNLNTVQLDNNQFLGQIPKIFGTFNQWNYHSLLLHNNYLSGALPSMPFSLPNFVYTFDQNCQLTSSLVYLGLQTHCKPGTAGQVTPTAFPSPSPTTRKSFIALFLIFFLTSFSCFLTVFLVHGSASSSTACK